MHLRVGSKGDLVRTLQSTLKESGFDPGPIDGIFGDKTRKAVVKFQESKKLEADGVRKAGPPLFISSTSSSMSKRKKGEGNNPMKWRRWNNIM